MSSSWLGALSDDLDGVRDMTRGQQTAIIVSVILVCFFIHLGFLLQTSARQVSEYPQCVGWFGVENERCNTDQMIDALDRAVAGLPQKP